MKQIFTILILFAVLQQGCTTKGPDTSMTMVAIRIGCDSPATYAFVSTFRFMVPEIARLEKEHMQRCKMQNSVLSGPNFYNSRIEVSEDAAKRAKKAYDLLRQRAIKEPVYLTGVSFGGGAICVPLKPLMSDGYLLYDVSDIKAIARGHVWRTAPSYKWPLIIHVPTKYKWNSKK